MELLEKLIYLPAYNKNILFQVCAFVKFTSAQLNLVLCCSNADVNAQNALGKHPLHLAAAEGHVPTVEALLAAGTKVPPSRVCALTSLVCRFIHDS